MLRYHRHSYVSLCYNHQKYRALLRLTPMQSKAQLTRVPCQPYFIPCDAPVNCLIHYLIFQVQVQMLEARSR
jgi:hypothetical protein